MSRFNTNAVSRESPDFFKTTHSFINPARKDMHITRRLKPNLINSTSDECPVMFHISSLPLLDGKMRYSELIKGSNKTSIIDQKTYMTLYDKSIKLHQRATLDNIQLDHTIKKQMNSTTKLSLQTDLMADKRPFYKTNNVPFYKVWNSAAQSKGFNIHTSNYNKLAKQQKITRVDKHALEVIQRASNQAYSPIISSIDEQLYFTSTSHTPKAKTSKKPQTVEELYIQLQVKNSTKKHSRCFNRYTCPPSLTNNRY